MPRVIFVIEDDVGNILFNDGNEVIITIIEEDGVKKIIVDTVEDEIGGIIEWET